VNIFPRWSRDGRTLFYTAYSGRYATDRFTRAEIRRIPAAGGSVEKVPVTTGSLVGFGDVGPQNKLIYTTDELKPAIYDPETKQSFQAPQIPGLLHRWSPDGKHIVSAAPNAVLVSTLPAPVRPVFQGAWIWFTWRAPDELYVMERRPDAKGNLWRVPLDGTPPVKTGLVFALIVRPVANVVACGFDIHPTKPRMAMMASEALEGDLGLIENTR